MKKFLMILLSVAFALNFVLVVGMIGEYISPRQAFYTITDEYEHSLSVQARMAAQKSFALTFEEMDRQRVHLFCILKLYKRNKNFFVLQ